MDDRVHTIDDPVTLKILLPELFQRSRWLDGNEEVRCGKKTIIDEAEAVKVRTTKSRSTETKPCEAGCSEK